MAPFDRFHPQCDVLCASVSTLQNRDISGLFPSHPKYLEPFFCFCSGYGRVKRLSRNDVSIWTVDACSLRHRTP